MDDKARTLRAQERRAAEEYLATIVPVLQRYGLPRMPGARRLGGVRFGHEFVAGPGRGPVRRRPGS